MIFPNDVHKRIQNQSKIAGENKTQLIITVFVLGNVFGFIGIRWFLVTFFGAPESAVILTHLTIALFVFVFVFRFLIFNENEKKKEFKGEESDSFAKYMYLRKDVIHDSSIGNKYVHFFEYVNGTSTCTLEFRFGSNDDNKADMSKEILDRIIGAVLNNGFEYRLVCMPEDFSNSHEFKEHVNMVNGIKDTGLRNAVMQITDGIMTTSYRECNVDVIYLTIRSVTNFQKYDLEMLTRTITGIIGNYVSAFRSVEFLNIDQLLEFYREFYRIAAIDLAMMKTIELAKDVDVDFGSIVQLFSVTSDTGKTFLVNANENNVFSTTERRIND